jgi:transcription-repair coupling factor (superfamily II helicase)
VKTLDHLRQLYKDDARTTQVLELLHHHATPRAQLLGLTGSQDAFVIAGAYAKHPRTTLVLAYDKDSATLLYDDIMDILEKKEIRFFPDSFKRPMQFEALQNDHVLLRTETINKLTSGLTSGEILVTYPEALFEKVVAPDILNENKINIEVNERVNLSFLIEILVEYGFDRVDFVFKPGQFSVRGDIVDIFSYGNELPYRVELFDEEVESIRTFDPTSQLSQQKIARVSIVPNVNTKFTQTQKVSLLKILPADTVIWVYDFQILIDKLQLCFEEAEKFAKTVSVMDTTELSILFRDRAFIYPAEVTEDIQRFPLFFLSKSPQPFTLDLKVNYQSKPQPSIGKNFKILIENLHENNNNLLENYIFADNPKQIERFYSIFQDLGEEVQFNPMTLGIHQGFIDLDLKIACYSDHQIFERYRKTRLKTGFSGEQAMTVRMLRELQPGDFVVHIDHGVGKFSGLEKITVGGHTQESVRLVYMSGDMLYVGINSLHKISKYVGKEGNEPKLSKLGTDTWAKLKLKTKRQIKDIAEELIKLYAKRRAAKGHTFPPDSHLQYELEASFIYEDTPDQVKSTQDVKADMERDFPMDRLVCGDVGFGKTEIAIRAAFKAVTDGKQVAVLVPTTILALQHYKTFSDRLKEFACDVDFVNRFKTAKEKKEIYAKLKSGALDIVIGTHSIAGKDVEFKDLGLLIIDEEQKFGVSVKEKLRQMKVNVDTLTLTATPIPRTLQFSLMAARDMSIIRTPPPNRQPIQTEVRIFNDALIKEVIDTELARGGQVFFVQNRVQLLPDMVAMLRELCPNVDVEMAHGQMDPDKLEKALLDFINHKFDVLVCTNIIETGLDIANANTIIINNAHHFGLSDLHQLRGRVGRSNRKAYCYLFCPPLSVLTSDARKRLKTIEEFSDLGGGFEIAMRDLDIRGAGNMLGAEQSGFISEIGFHTYQKILDEAIQELKETDFQDLFKEELNKKKTFIRDTEIESDVEMLIPTAYVENTQERLNLYTELDAIENEEELEEYGQKLHDRFGRLPEQVRELFNGLRLRWIAKVLGFERISLKENKLRCYFVQNPQSRYYESELFKNILRYVSINGKKEFLSLKQTPKNLIMIKEKVNSLSQANKVLVEMKGKVEQ